MQKSEWRKRMIEQRLALGPEERQRLSLAAQESVTGSAAFTRAALVLLYEPVRGEVATERIAAAAVAAGKGLALPRVQKSPRRLWLHRWDGDPASLHTGAYSIREPDPAWPQVAPGEVDLVVVPGTVFDRAGGRLGYGAGYYDRLLREIRTARPQAVFIGLAYPFQVVDGLPQEAHDVPLDGVATASGLIAASRG